MARSIVNFIDLKMLRKFHCFFFLFIGYIGCTNTNAVIMDFCWRDYIPGYLPDDALEGAPGLYIGQVSHHGNCPACIYPHSNIAITELFGKMTFTNNIKILCTSQPGRFYWESVNFKEVSRKQMENAVKVGFLSGSFADLYIGKVKEGDEWKIGRVMPIDSSIRGLWIWNTDDKPARIYEFEILKYNATDPKCTTSVHAQK